MLKSFREFLIEKEEEVVSDSKGPGGGKQLSKMSSDEHIKAMQHHSTKYNELKSGKGEKDAAQHINDHAAEYHRAMYHLHKSASTPPSENTDIEPPTKAEAEAGVQAKAKESAKAKPKG